MDKRDAVNIARVFASELMTKYECKQFFLFGSYAKGTNQEESDIDIAVILKDFQNPIEMRLELMRLRRKIDSRIEPHPFREKEFNMTNPIVNEILKHGQQIVTSIA
ncbi:MAG: nucleotidyltransferase domain-containing protein [Desulfobacterales bacterium]|nr:nucleotidyltransferase domain-containing protein [Desulfobacterales bacterium]